MQSLARRSLPVILVVAAAVPRIAVAIPTYALGGASYTQSFDAMPNTATSALPAGWVFASGSAPTWASGTLAATTQVAGTVGSGTLTTTSAGGAYLFVNGTAATGTDKAIGFLSSSSFSSPRSILFGLTNDTGATISALDVGWIYEKYRNGTRQFDWTFFGSTDGTAWTTIAGGGKSYPADANTNPIALVSSTVSPLRLSGLAVAPGAAYYLRWDYAGSGGSSSAQALGIDAFSLVVAGSTPPVYGTYWDPVPSAGLGGSGTWAANSPVFATSVAGTSVGLLKPADVAIFSGSSGTVTVSGSVAAGGLSFTADGYALTGGVVRLGASGTIAAASGVVATIAATLAADPAAAITFDASSTASILVSGSVSGGAGLRKTGAGDLVLAGSTAVSGTTVVADGWLRLGAGGTTGGVGGPIAIATPNAALVIDRSDDLTVANVISGSGGFFKEGGNVVTLTGSNSYAGGTTLFAGTVVVGDGGTSGVIATDAPLDLAAGTALVFDRNDDVAFRGTVAGAGTLAQRGDGRLVLSHAGAIGPSFTLRAEAGVVDLDRSGSAITDMLGAGNVVELAGGTLELSATSGAGTRLTAAAITVAGNGTLAIRRTGVAGDHVTTGFDCPLTIADSGTLVIDYRGAFVGPTLPPVRYRGTTTFSGETALEGNASVSVTNSAGGTAEVILAGTVAQPSGASFTKFGDQTLTLACSGTLSGPTRVAEGHLRIAAPALLASSSVTVAGGATLAVAPAVQISVRSLAIEATGLLDVTSGGVTIAAGSSTAEFVARLLEGRGDGSWNGTSGITSSAAAADLAASIPRTVGWLDNGGGSLTASYAAAGDTNLDGSVDILDGANFLAGGRFDTGTPASWNEGDFGYDGLVDILDAADFLSTGLFDAGPYGTAAAVGTITAVPEPAPLAGIAALACWVSTRCCMRMRRTSAIVHG
jgi:autotransporter-associated beta strand protein